MKIFPKLYQSLFQIGSKSFDTDSLLKCLSAEIKTYEQYEKFVVARYMFWKYFSKLKANFYCDSCEVILTENRFVCLECREHCLCFNCFSKSVIDETGSLDSGVPPADAAGAAAAATNSKAAKKKHQLSNTHKASHRMLLLDHICNKCGSLIIGKRFHCEECDDYDLCLMCYKRADSPAHDTPHQHDKCHATSTIEPVILVAKPEHVLDVQVYLYLHSQVLFTVMTLRVSNLIAAATSAMLNEDNEEESTLDSFEKGAFSYKHVKQLHANCFRLLMFMSNSIVNSKCKSPCQDFDEFKNLSLYATYNQESLIGLASSAIKISKHYLKSGQPIEPLEYTFPSTYLSQADIWHTFFSLNPRLDTAAPAQINLYQLIAFFLHHIITKEDYLVDETFVSMLISILKALLLDSEPDKVDLVVKQVVFNLKHKYEYLKLIESNETSHKTELTLELILNWIDESIGAGRIGLVTLYVNIISSLNSNVSWKPKVLNFIDKTFSLILDSFNSCPMDEAVQSNQSKLFNFLYALNCAPLSTGIGQWIEFKNENRMEGIGNSFHQFKLGLLKSLHYDGASNAFSMWAFDPESRKIVNFKDLKYNCDFRKPDDNTAVKNETNLELNTGLVVKLIQLFKKLLSKYKITQTDIENLSMSETDDLVKTAASTSCSSSSPLKQKLLRYELMHIDRKKEVNQIFQQLQLKNNLLLLSVLTLIKDFIVKKNREDEAAACEQTDDSNEDSLVDYEFVNWIAKLAFSNTNMNAYWKISHLRCYLVSLLLREGFENLKTADTAEINQENLKKTTRFVFIIHI